MKMKPVRRMDREIATHEASELFERCEYGTLSTVSNDGQPYGIPLSYAIKDNCIYFHCALTGHKLENIDHNSKVSFSVVGNTKVLPDKFATEYESAVAFGIASEIHGQERIYALMYLVQKYSPDFIEEGRKYIDQKDNATRVFKIEISHMSGKARR
jgi:nitroimidazol reductase NimA-like FMN-containing flavoprotein (pyridoxamine 5'-phosphate oxidase superfamily)